MTGSPTSSEGTANLCSAAPRIVAAVTAYCDQDALIKTLCAIAAQTPIRIFRILVVDNSPSSLALPQLDQVPIEHIHTEHNPGLVAGVNMAVDWAVQQQADFLWLFDQDSLPAPDCLHQLWNGWQQLEARGIQPGIVGPAIQETGTGRPHHGYEFLGYRYRMMDNPQSTDGYYLCDMILHSGSLIHTKPSPLLEPLPEWIFLDAQEHALAEQMLEQDKVVAVIPAARLEHRYGIPVQIQKKGRTYLLQDYSPLRYYTICRNQTWFELRHAQGIWNRFRAFLYALKRCCKLCRNIRLLKTSDARLKAALCREGTWAGIIGRKTIPEKAKPHYEVAD